MVVLALRIVLKEHLRELAAKKNAAEEAKRKKKKTLEARALACRTLRSWQNQRVLLKRGPSALCRYVEVMICSVGEVSVDPCAPSFGVCWSTKCSA